MRDRLSLKQYFDTYAGDLLRVSYSYVKDWQMAEDIVQEVFLNFWEKFDSFRGESTIQTYLTRAVINRSKDYLKSWKYRTHYLTNEFLQSIKPKKQLIKQEERETIGNAVLSLPIEQREVIILYFFNQLTYKEIGELLALSETAVRKRMGKAKESLRVKLVDEQWEVYLHDEDEG